MKIVRTDNFDRETEAERLVAENIQIKHEADTMLKALQDTCTSYSQNWYVLKPDDYVLWRGMADLIGDAE
jgi:hypothetical protein